MAGWVPRALSPLSLSPLQPSLDEIIFQGSSEDDSPTIRAAKRKRREALGQEYLRGRPPLLLTAGLRGRFDKNWNNPWTKVRSEAPQPKRGHRQVARASKSAERSLGNHHTVKVPDKVAPDRIDNVGSRQERQPHAVARYIRPRSSLSNVSSSASSEAGNEEEEEMQNVRPRRRVKTVLERGNNGRAGLRGTSRGGARRQVDRISEPLAGNERRNVRDGKAYKKSLCQSDSPSPARRIERSTGQYVSPISDQSAFSGSENDLQQPVIRRRKSPAERLADALESASRIKHKGLREQTLAFCEDTRKDADRKRAMSPFPDISVQERSKPGHIGKRSWDHSREPPTEPYTRKCAALSVEGGQVSDGDTAKRRKMASVEQQQTDRPEGQSVIPESHIPNEPRVSDPPDKVNVPIDFFVQSLQEMLAVASEAHRWKERLGSLTAEALATMPENERKKLFGSILSLTSIAPNAAHDDTSPRAVRKSLDVLSVQEDPVFEARSRTSHSSLQKLPAVEDRVTNTKFSTMDPPLSPIKEKRAGQAGNKPSTNTSSKSASTTGYGVRTRGGKPMKHLSFTGSGEVKIQVRRSQEDVTDPNTNKPLSMSNLPEAQVVSNQPVLNTHLTSGSTNLLETDKPLVDDFDAEFSTQAALEKAQRSFQFDLVAHQGRPVNSQPTSVAREGPISPSKHGGRDTRSSPIKDSFGEHTEDSPLNTQDMVNAWTPFAVTTFKKPAQRQYVEASPLELKAARSKIPGSEDRQFAKPEPRSRSSLSHKLLPSDSAVDHANDKTPPNDEQVKTPHGSKSSVFTESKLATPPSDDSPPMRVSADLYTKAFDMSKLVKSPTRLSHSQPLEAQSAGPHHRQQPNSQPTTNFPGQASDSNAPPLKSQLSSSKLPSSLINFPSSVSAGTTAQQDGQRQSVIDRGLEEAENFLGTWDIESQLRSAGLANTNSASKFGDPKGGRASERRSQRSGK